MGTAHITNNVVSSISEKHFSDFNYLSESGLHNRTAVANEKDIAFEYHFNTNGFTTAILEQGASAGHLKTLTKDGGCLLPRFSGDTVGSINGQPAVKIGSNNVIYGFNLVNGIPTSKEEFIEIKNYCNKVSKNNENFVVSFWLKLPAESSAKTVNVTLNRESECYIDSEAKNVWQYVTVPVKLDETSDGFAIPFSFGVKLLPSVEGALLANARIAPNQPSEIVLKNDNGDEALLPLGITTDKTYCTQVTIYTPSSIIRNLNSEFFITEKDLFLTFKSLRIKTGSTFDFHHNGGTKRIGNVTKVVLTDSKSKLYELKLQNNIPNYTSKRYLNQSRYAKSPLFVTDIVNILTSKLTFFSNYFKQENTLQLGSDTVGAKSNYTCVYYNGLQHSQIDSNGIETRYTYANGNLTQINKQKKSGTTYTGNKIIQDIVYDSTKEFVSSFGDGLTTHSREINEPFDITKTATSGSSTLSNDFDEHFEKLKEVKAYKGINLISSNLAARYEYDTFGECTITYNDGLAIAELNPFRWKSYYFDTETGLSAMDSRYYDPSAGVYVDADDIENTILNSATVNALDRNAITVDNVFTLLGNLNNIFTSAELYPDLDYDPYANWTWWDKNWEKVIKWTVRVALVVAGLLLAGIFGGLPAVLFALKSGLIGAAVGGLIGGIISTAQGNGFFSGTFNGIVNGFLDGFATGLFFSGLSAMVSAIAGKVNVANASATSVKDKLQRYLLNTNHPGGASKANWFKKTLGFDLNCGRCRVWNIKGNTEWSCQSKIC